MSYLHFLIRPVLVLVFCVFLFSCQQNKVAIQEEHLNGYWEIAYVELADGTRKDYNVNQTIDYFTVTANNGYRRKVMPQVNGKYQYNSDAEKFRLDLKAEVPLIYYTTPYASWKEEIKALSKEQLVLKNNQMTFYYKRPALYSLK